MSATPATPEFYFNPYDEEFRANPYPHYKALYAGPPRLINLGLEMALAARYADVKAVLLDHANFSSVQPDLGVFQEQNDLFGTDPSMLFADQPVHTRLRRLVSRDFTPRRIRELEPRIRAITNDLFDAAQKKGSLDVMADIANALPVMVIAEMLGVAPEMYQTFKHWSDKIIEADNVLPGMPMPEEIKTAMKELRAYFLVEIEKRRAKQGPDLVSALVAAHEQSEALSAGELLQFVVLLLLAGNETTTNLIGNGTLALGRNPEQMALLRSKPELMPSAIEEMLRYDGPVQSTFRTTTRDINLGGTDLKAKTGVFAMVAAANRDPTHFPNPDKFDITRDPNDHLAFGEGIHFCLGSGLARLEGAAAIGTMLERFPKLRFANPDAPLKYKGSYFLRGLAHLEMAID
ncbi:MAG: cytochrome P450 [Candidatus Binataceae bacterium]